MVAITRIRYRDIAQAELAERARLANRLGQLAKIEENRKILTAEEQAEKARISAILAIVGEDKDELCEPLFVGVRDLFNASPGLLDGFLDNHENGVLQGALLKAGAGSFSKESICKAALTLGLLMADGAAVQAPRVLAIQIVASTAEPAAATVNAEAANAARPRTARPNRLIVADTSTPQWRQLSKLFFAAIGEAQSMQDLAMLVLPLLAQEGDPRQGDAFPGTVDAAEFGRVMRALVQSGVTADEPQLRRRINEVLDKLQFRGPEEPEADLGIDLPSLEEASDADIIPVHCQQMGVFICGAMFDELKVFEVVDKLAELFQHGMLAISSGNAGKQLYKYWKDAPNRMSEGERRNFYAMTMGLPGGEATMVNREFNDLWLRFVSSVSSFIRQNEVDKLLRASLPSPISHQQVRKAARDLAVNLSAHGYGMAHYAALDLQAQIKFMINLLGDQDIRANYGARDMWQVVDQVATLELGGAKTSSRYRTLATCGAIITAWLANNADRIRSPGGPLIDIDEVRSPMPRTNGSKATTQPTDYDLVNACELWLADTATSDSVVDQMSQPREAPVMTSRPVPIPSIAREMLADLPDVGMGMSMPMPNYAGTRH